MFSQNRSPAPFFLLTKELPIPDKQYFMMLLTPTPKKKTHRTSLNTVTTALLNFNEYYSVLY